VVGSSCTRIIGNAGQANEEGGDGRSVAVPYNLIFSGRVNWS
jgi:hypothetical protein